MQAQLLQPAWLLKKLPPAKFARMKSRWEALQATFSGRLDIFYPLIFRVWDENGVFQQAQEFALSENLADRVSERNRDLVTVTLRRAAKAECQFDASS